MTQTIKPIEVDTSLGVLWDSFDHSWEAWPITRITPKRIFAQENLWAVVPGGENFIWGRGQTVSFDRAKLERDGRAYYNAGTSSRHFYTEAGKATANVFLREAANV